jgi:hypothetical protein
MLDNRPKIGRTDVRDAPTTPMRIIVGIVLAAAFVAVHLVLIVIDAPVALEVSIMLGAFILVQEGIDVAQWGYKRHTDRDYQLAKSGTPKTVVTSEHTVVRAETAQVAAAPVTPAAPSTTPTSTPIAIDADLSSPPPGRGELARREPERGEPRETERDTERGDG